MKTFLLMLSFLLLLFFFKRKEGEPPLVCSPLCKARLCKFTPRGALNAFAGRCPEPCKLFEKSLTKTAEWVLRKLVSYENISSSFTEDYEDISYNV